MPRVMPPLFQPYSADHTDARKEPFMPRVPTVTAALFPLPEKLTTEKVLRAFIDFYARKTYRVNLTL